MRLHIKLLSIITLGLTIFLFSFFGLSSLSYSYGSALVRVMHASPDAPAVDILLDGHVVVSNLSYKDASGFLQIEAGIHNIKVNVAGTSATVIDEDVNLAQGSISTVIAVNFLSQIDTLILPDTNLPPSEYNLKIRVVHGSPTAPAVDVYVTAPEADLSVLNPTVKDLAFLEYSGFLEIPGGSYQIRVTPANSKTIAYDSGPITLNAGSILTSVAVDSTGGKSIISIVALTNAPDTPCVEIPDRQAQLRVVHASPDAPNVDVLIDNKIVLSNVAFKEYNQDYLAVESGSRNIKVNATGTSTSVIDTTAELAAGTDYTVLAVGFLADIEPLILIDDNTKPSPGKAKVRVVHSSPDAPNVDVLVDNQVVLTNVAFKESSGFLEVDAGARNVKVNVTGTSTSVIDTTPTLEDGGVYLVIALNKVTDIEVLLIRTN
jgi:hypothetical protein